LSSSSNLQGHPTAAAALGAPSRSAAPQPSAATMSPGVANGQWRPAAPPAHTHCPAPATPTALNTSRYIEGAPWRCTRTVSGRSKNHGWRVSLPFLIVSRLPHAGHRFQFHADRPTNSRKDCRNPRPRSRMFMGFATPMWLFYNHSMIAQPVSVKARAVLRYHHNPEPSPTIDTGTVESYTAHSFFRVLTDLSSLSLRREGEHVIHVPALRRQSPCLASVPCFRSSLLDEYAI